MTNRIASTAALLAAVFFGGVGDAAAQKVALKKGAPTVAEKPVEPKSTPKSTAESASESESAESSASAAENDSPKAEPAPKKPAKSEKSGKSDVLTPLPTAPLTPPTLAELNAKHPVSPIALRATLENLATTKLLGDVRVLKATARVPREEFVPKAYRARAYADSEIPLGNGSTVASPFDVAFALEALDLRPTDRVLDVGLEGGVRAATLGTLVAETYSVESDAKAAKAAVETLTKLNFDSVFVRVGNLEDGWAEAGPFDKIVVSRAAKDVPPKLVAQLKVGGKLIIPIGDARAQYWTLCEKREDGSLDRRETLPTCRPVFDVDSNGSKGKRGSTDDAFDVESPELVGGGFETLDPEPFATAPQNAEKDSTSDSVGTAGDVAAEDAPVEKTVVDAEDAESKVALPKPKRTPAGWFGARDAFVAEREDAPEGTSVCVCDNASVVAEQLKKARDKERIEAATLPEDRIVEPAELEQIRAGQREREIVCRLRQNVPLDGARVKKLTISGNVRSVRLLSQNAAPTVELAAIRFFDRDREPLGEPIPVLSVEPTAFERRTFAEEVAVPKRAASAVLEIGIFDAIGTVEFDALALKNKYERPEKKR